MRRHVLIAAYAGLALGLGLCAGGCKGATLAADARRGVNVRVILDQHLEKKIHTPAYTFLRSHGVRRPP